MRGGAWNPDSVSYLTVTGAAPGPVLDLCVREGLTLWQVEASDPYTLVLAVPLREEQRIREIFRRRGCQITKVRRQGLWPALYAHRRRLFAAILLISAVFLLLWSRAFIWDIQVMGNTQVSERAILDALDECGVGIGTFWPDLTQDNVRADLLLRLPELSWATVNIYGSRAVVLVRERTPKPEMFSDGVPMDICARREGFVTHVAAMQGSAQVRRGDAVLPGQVLIASRNAHGDLTHASGCIQGLTYETLTAVFPLARERKVYTERAQHYYALQIGDRHINFYRNSSIPPSFCDTLYRQYPLEIQGLFSLPVCLTCITVQPYTLYTCQADAKRASGVLSQTLWEALQADIASPSTAGEILSSHESLMSTPEMLIACLHAQCQVELGESVPHTPELDFDPDAGE